jgi:hypothetical protein
MKVTGIDISRHKLKIVTLKKRWTKKIEIIKYDDLTLHDNLSFHTITSYLKDALDGTPKQVILSVPRKYVIMKIIEMPPIKNYDYLKQALQYEIEEHIPYPAKDIVYDFCILSQTEKMIRLLLVGAQISIVKHYLDEIAIPYENITVSVSSLCLLNMYRSMSNTSDWIMVDIIAEYPELFVIKNNILTSIHTISASNNISLEINQILTNFPEIKTIVVVGDKKVLTKREGIEVVDFMLPEYIKISPDIHDVDIHAISLACSGIYSGQWTVNLHPEKEMQIRKNIYKQMSVGLILICWIIVSISVLYWINADKKAYELYLVKEEIRKIKPEIVKIINKKKEIDKLMGKIELLKCRACEITPGYYINILERFTELLPSSNTWIEEIIIYDKKISITGYTVSVAYLISILDKCPYFTDIEPIGTIVREKVKEQYIEKFKINMRIKR